MVSWDYYVGFEREPEGLEAFLKSKGYQFFPVKRDTSIKSYESEDETIDVTFFPFRIGVRNAGHPDWTESGLDIKSELMVSTKGSVAQEGAERLSEEIARRYNAIIFDPQGDEYLRSEDL